MSTVTEESVEQEEQQHEQQNQLSLKIAKIFDEVRSSGAMHVRKLKELSALIRSSSSPTKFCAAFCKTLTPIFNFSRRTVAAERVVKFAAIFACLRNSKDDDGGDELLEGFLKFLLVASGAADKTVRFRACQFVSEIIMRLPDDAEVSNELWDEVIDCMKIRVNDKAPLVRSYAVRALSRFANDADNADILELFLENLQLEQNADVRKTIMLSLPPSSETLSVIIDRTLDVSESVRKAAYCVLASKFPLQSLSIKFRTIVLQRGLADRSAAVTKECFKLMKEDWLEKCCSGDPIVLLKFLDVETYESVGELVLNTLLKAGLVKVQDGQSIMKFSVNGDTAKGECDQSVKLMEAEVALYWRMVCKHLQMEAHNKGSDAAMSTGMESAVYASEASDKNDLLDNILPTSISEYVDLVMAHIAAGPNYRFASRQLLLLGALLDFSDSSNRKTASEYLHHLLHIPLDIELDENGSEIVMGDGFSLGGEKVWAFAVAELARKIHASTGEFEEVLLAVVEELAQPCRERTADFKQWSHCLALVALVLENTTSFRHMQGKAIDPAEILHSILLPGAKHANLDVQRSAIRCLGLFGLLERKPSDNVVKQLRYAFIKGPPSATMVASTALLDLGIWHGLDEMDKAVNCYTDSNKSSLREFEFCNGSEDSDIQLLDLLCAGLGHDWGSFIEIDENHCIQGIIGEGLAKILLVSHKFPKSQAAIHHLLLAKLISLYFSHDGDELQRLKQCLSVFFEHYPSLSANNKKCLSKAFVPVIRSLWPGIDGNAAGSTLVVSNLRKRAVQASRFMLQMMKVPLITKETTNVDDNEIENKTDFECGEEGLAIRIAAEISTFHAKKRTAGEKAYLSALCHVLVLLQFRASDQGPVKLMRRLLNRVSLSLAAEKDLVKELRQMAERLKAIDMHPDEILSTEESYAILEKLVLEIDLEESECKEVPPTPAPQSTRQTRVRRKVKRESSSSEDEHSPTSVVPTTPAVTSTRSQRASKTAALTRITTKTTFTIDEDDATGGEEDDEDEDSEVTSEDGF